MTPQALCAPVRTSVPVQGKPGSVRARGRGRDPGAGAFLGAEPPPRQQQPPALSRLWAPPFCRVLPQDRLTGLAPCLPPQVPRQLHGQLWGVWENRWCSGLSRSCWQSPSTGILRGSPPAVAEAPAPLTEMPRINFTESLHNLMQMNNVSLACTHFLSTCV